MTFEMDSVEMGDSRVADRLAGLAELEVFHVADLREGVDAKNLQKSSGACPLKRRGIGDRYGPGIFNEFD